MSVPCPSFPCYFLVGENQKGTAGRGWQLRQTSRQLQQFATSYNNFPSLCSIDMRHHKSSSAVISRHKCHNFFFGNGPKTVSESTVSNTELREFFGELSEFLSAHYLCVNANSPSSSQNSPSLPQNSVRLSEFSSPKRYSRNSIPPVS